MRHLPVMALPQDSKRWPLSRLAGWVVALALVFLSVFEAMGAETQTPRQAGMADFAIQNDQPAFEEGKGPLAVIHRHVSPYVQRGALEALAIVLRSDGYRVEWLDEPLSADLLSRTGVLIVANAYVRGGERDYRNFSVLDAPQVYDETETGLIEQWVAEGGSLLLLADHSPFAGGTIALAARFGFTYLTGHAVRRDSTANALHVHMDFRKPDHDAPVETTAIGALGEHEITNGATGRSPIGHFYTFGGQAIIAPADASVLLTIPEGFDAILSQDIRREFYSAPRIPVGSLAQGAVKTHGEGRVAVFGETGAFTAQMIDGQYPIGFVDPRADENTEFVLATLRWLVRFQPGN